MFNFAPRWTLLALALISLNACGTASSNPTCVCPPIKGYSREFQNKLANEVKAAPPDVIWPEVVMDCFVLKTEMKECFSD